MTIDFSEDIVITDYTGEFEVRNIGSGLPGVSVLSWSTKCTDPDELNKCNIYVAGNQLRIILSSEILDVDSGPEARFCVVIGSGVLSDLAGNTFLGLNCGDQCEFQVANTQMPTVSPTDAPTAVP